MTTHEFVFIVDRDITDEEVDTLFGGDCDDAMPETGNGRTQLAFAREAEHLSAAIVSALNDVERIGLRVSGIESEDWISLKEIAERTGRSHESVRLLAKGARGPGGFPAPLSSTAATWTFYSWAQVADWFARNYDQHFEYDRVLVAADLLIRARALLRGDPEAAELAKIVA